MARSMDKEVRYNYILFQFLVNVLPQKLESRLQRRHVKYNTYITYGARGGVVVKALLYKPAGRGFDSRWCHWNFSVT